MGRGRVFWGEWVVVGEEREKGHLLFGFVRALAELSVTDGALMIALLVVNAVAMLVADAGKHGIKAKKKTTGVSANSLFFEVLITTGAMECIEWTVTCARFAPWPIGA